MATSKLRSLLDMVNGMHAKPYEDSSPDYHLTETRSRPSPPIVKPRETLASYLEGYIPPSSLFPVEVPRPAPPPHRTEKPPKPQQTSTVKRPSLPPKVTKTVPPRGVPATTTAAKKAAVSKPKAIIESDASQESERTVKAREHLRTALQEITSQFRNDLVMDHFTPVTVTRSVPTASSRHRHPVSSESESVVSSDSSVSVHQPRHRSSEKRRSHHEPSSSNSSYTSVEQRESRKSKKVTSRSPPRRSHSSSRQHASAKPSSHHHHKATDQKKQRSSRVEYLRRTEIDEDDINSSVDSVLDMSPAISEAQRVHQAKLSGVVLEQMVPVPMKVASPTMPAHSPIPLQASPVPQPKSSSKLSPAQRPSPSNKQAATTATSEIATSPIHVLVPRLPLEGLQPHPEVSAAVVSLTEPDDGSDEVENKRLLREMTPDHSVALGWLALAKRSSPLSTWCDAPHIAGPPSVSPVTTGSAEQPQQRLQDMLSIASSNHEDLFLDSVTLEHMEEKPMTVRSELASPLLPPQQLRPPIVVSSVSAATSPVHIAGPAAVDVSMQTSVSHQTPSEPRDTLLPYLSGTHSVNPMFQSLSLLSATPHTNAKSSSLRPAFTPQTTGQSQQPSFTELNSPPRIAVQAKSVAAELSPNTSAAQSVLSDRWGLEENLTTAQPSVPSIPLSREPIEPQQRVTVPGIVLSDIPHYASMQPSALFPHMSEEPTIRAPMRIAESDTMRTSSNSMFGNPSEASGQIVPLNNTARSMYSAISRSESQIDRTAMRSARVSIDSTQELLEILQRSQRESPLKPSVPRTAVSPSPMPMSLSASTPAMEAHINQSEYSSSMYSTSFYTTTTADQTTMRTQEQSTFVTDRSRSLAAGDASAAGTGSSGSVDTSALTASLHDMLGRVALLKEQIAERDRLVASTAAIQPTETQSDNGLELSGSIHPALLPPAELEGLSPKEEDAQSERLDVNRTQTIDQSLTSFGLVAAEPTNNTTVSVVDSTFSESEMLPHMESEHLPVATQQTTVSLPSVSAFLARDENETQREEYISRVETTNANMLTSFLKRLEEVHAETRAALLAVTTHRLAAEQMVMAASTAIRHPDVPMISATPLSAVEHESVEVPVATPHGDIFPSIADVVPNTVALQPDESLELPHGAQTPSPTASIDTVQTPLHQRSHDAWLQTDFHPPPLLPAAAFDSNYFAPAESTPHPNSFGGSVSGNRTSFERTYSTLGTQTSSDSYDTYSSSQTTSTTVRASFVSLTDLTAAQSSGISTNDQSAVETSTFVNVSESRDVELSQWSPRGLATPSPMKTPNIHRFESLTHFGDNVGTPAESATNTPRTESTNVQPIEQLHETTPAATPDNQDTNEDARSLMTPSPIVTAISDIIIPTPTITSTAAVRPESIRPTSPIIIYDSPAPIPRAESKPQVVVVSPTPSLSPTPPRTAPQPPRSSSVTSITSAASEPSSASLLVSKISYRDSTATGKSRTTPSPIPDSILHATPSDSSPSIHSTMPKLSVSREQSSAVIASRAPSISISSVSVPHSTTAVVSQLASPIISQPAVQKFSQPLSRAISSTSKTTLLTPPVVGSGKQTFSPLVLDDDDLLRLQRIQETLTASLDASTAYALDRISSSRYPVDKSTPVMTAPPLMSRTVSPIRVNTEPILNIPDLTPVRPYGDAILARARSMSPPQTNARSLSAILREADEFIYREPSVERTDISMFLRREAQTEASAEVSRIHAAHISHESSAEFASVARSPSASLPSPPALISDASTRRSLMRGSSMSGIIGRNMLSQPPPPQDQSSYITGRSFSVPEIVSVNSPQQSLFGRVPAPLRPSPAEMLRAIQSERKLRTNEREKEDSIQMFLAGLEHTIDDARREERSDFRR